MLKKLTLIIASIGLMAVSMLPATSVLAADSAAKGAACSAIDGVYGSGSCSTGGSSVDSIIATVVNIFSWIVGVIAVIFVIYSGFRYITAGGDAGKISGAKNTLVYAIIGLVIAVSAQLLVQLVLNKLGVK